MSLGVIAATGFTAFATVEPLLDSLNLPQQAWLMGGSYRRFDELMLELCTRRGWFMFVYDFNPGKSPPEKLAKQALRLMKGLLQQPQQPQPPRLLIFTAGAELGTARVARDAAEMYGIPVLLDSDLPRYHILCS